MSKITIHTEKKAYIFKEALQFLINWLRLYHNIGQRTLLLLSGGSATKLYPALAEFIKSSDLDFSFLAIGQVDERFFGKEQTTNNKEHINAKIIKQTGLWETCAQKKIPYYLISQEGSLESSTAAYDKIISGLFGRFPYKVGVLGIGEDCHTAGLLPGYEKFWNKDAFAAGYANAGKFSQRITVTPDALSFLDQAVVVAAGKKKRQAIENALKKENLKKLNKYPAAIMHNIKRVDLFTDELILTKGVI